MYAKRDECAVFCTSGRRYWQGSCSYLNASLGGHNFIQKPPSVTFKLQGKLITVHSKKIAINALKNEAEATKIIEWLKREINSVWENRREIEPSFESTPTPKLIEILQVNDNRWADFATAAWML